MVTFFADTILFINQDISVSGTLVAVWVGRWMRAKIVNHYANHADLYLIDTGNHQVCHRQLIFELDEDQKFDHAPRAIPLVLKGAMYSWWKPRELAQLIADLTVTIELGTRH